VIVASPLEAAELVTEPTTELVPKLLATRELDVVELGAMLLASGVLLGATMDEGFGVEPEPPPPPHAESDATKESAQRSFKGFINRSY